MRILRTVVPLSKCAGCVACIPEQLGDSDLVGAHCFVASRHAVHPGTDVVSTGQQAGPRRGANRTDEETVEPRPLRRDPVVHRRVDQWIAVRPHVAKPLIVSQHKHDVGTTINSQERVVNRRQQEQ